MAEKYSHISSQNNDEIFTETWMGCVLSRRGFTGMQCRKWGNLLVEVISIGVKITFELSGGQVFGRPS